MTKATIERWRRSVEQAEYDAQQARENAVAWMRAVGKRLLQDAERYERDGDAATMNSLGEVQGAGATVDTAVAKAAALRDAATRARAALEMAAEEVGS